MIASNKRKERDLMKLMMSDYEVSMIDEKNQYDFHVLFRGPKDSAYEGVSLNLTNRVFGKYTSYSLTTILISHLRLDLRIGYSIPMLTKRKNALLNLVQVVYALM
jgi:hypothetical protein